MGHAASALLLAALAQAQPGKPAQVPPGGPAQGAAPLPLCDGDYADALPAATANRAFDPHGDPFVFAIRNTATYEHVYYGRDGKLRKEYLRTVVHGTGFSLRVQNGETLLVTNEHVASQPEVTDDEHPVEGVPQGSKKVREQLKIVRDESDDYEPGHTTLSKVFSDPAADIAVIKAKKPLPVLPFRIGRSSALRSGNLVQVRGFPLGAFAAVNSGKVVNPYTRDTERAWQHADFVIDALLSSGNSGSPVFAISCRTGDPELVGVFHAGYAEATALNVVVAVDQLREELDTLKLPRRDPAVASEITAADRDRVVAQLAAEPTHKLLFPFGPRAAQLQLADPGTLRFALLDEDFPLSSRESLALIDHARTGFGTLDALVLTGDGQPAEVPAAALDPDAREHFERLYDSLWHQLLAVLDYRAALARQRVSADAFAGAQAARTRLRRKAPEQKEILGLAFFDADRAGTAPLRMAGSEPDGGTAAAPAPSSDIVAGAANGSGN